MGRVLCAVQKSDQLLSVPTIIIPICIIIIIVCTMWCVCWMGPGLRVVCSALLVLGVLCGPAVAGPALLAAQLAC